MSSQAHTEKTSDVKALHVMREWETQTKKSNTGTHLELQTLPTLTCNGWTNCHRH